MDFLPDNFVLTLAAPRKSGKSYLVKKILKEGGLAKRFTHIFIFCPSLDLNDDYKDFADDPKFNLISKITYSKVEEVFSKQIQCKRSIKKREKETGLTDWDCPKTLIIMDDCIDSGILSFRGIMDKLAERGRHMDLSGIFCSQRIGAISKSIRLNSDLFIFFTPYSILELEKFLEEFIPYAFRKSAKLKFLKIFEEKYHFIILDNAEHNPFEKIKTSVAEDFIKGKLSVVFTESDIYQNKNITE